MVHVLLKAGLENFEHYLTSKEIETTNIVVFPTIELERLEISSRKSEIPRKHFMQRLAQ